MLDYRRNGGTSAGVCHGRTDRGSDVVAHMRVARWLAGANQCSGTGQGKVNGDMVSSLSCMCCKEKPAQQQKRSESQTCCWWVSCVSTHTATYEEFMVLWKTIVLPMSSLMHVCYFAYC